MRGCSLSLGVVSSRLLLLSHCPLLRLITSTSSSFSQPGRIKIPKMDATKSSHSHTISSKSSTTASSSTIVERFQQVFRSDSTGGGWHKCWEEGLMSWDLGQPTPVLLHLHYMGALPKGRALVPGCGSLSSSSSNVEYFEFLKADFFTWCPMELFDFIFDYTFFCALEPDMRSSWAVKMRDLLKPDGELMTLMFPISDRKGGPPYKVSVTDYEEVLHPVGFKAISIEENELAVEPRKGAEKLARWKRSFFQSSL